MGVSSDSLPYVATTALSIPLRFVFVLEVNTPSGVVEEV